MWSASRFAAPMSSMLASDPGTTGTPFAIAAARPAILSPISSIDSGDGPTKVRSCSAQRRAKPAFSAMNP